MMEQRIVQHPGDAGIGSRNHGDTHHVRAMRPHEPGSTMSARHVLHRPGAHMIPLHMQAIIEAAGRTADTTTESAPTESPACV